MFTQSLGAYQCFTASSNWADECDTSVFWAPAEKLWENPLRIWEPLGMFDPLSVASSHTAVSPNGSITWPS